MAPSRGKNPKPSQVVKPTIKRRRTTSHRNHVFESFNARISRLKIAPLRASRLRHDLDPTSSDLTSSSSSYLATDLAEWSDRNLSAGFTAFAEAVAPLAENLPMVMHHAEQIFSCFEEGLKEGERYALEPLCALLGSFAHDLGTGFAPFFARAFRLVAEVAAGKEQPADVVEWCFAALAWLVKYMSRMLLEDEEDARSWWRDVGIWLGRERQKPFIVRFTGEVVGFLLRRAAKDEERIRRVLGWLLEDFLAVQDNAMYADGLKVAVTEAVKGVNHGVHSAGVLVLTELIKFAYGREETERRKVFDSLIQGTIISVIHHTDQKGFQPIEEALLEHMKGREPTKEHVAISSGLISVITATRKGTRISAWDQLVKMTSVLVDWITTISTTQPALLQSVIFALGNTFVSAPIHTAVKHASTFDELSAESWVHYFLPLCFFVADISSDRFKTLLLKPFQKFIVSHWQDMEAAMMVAVPRLCDVEAFAQGDIKCPEAWSNQMSATMRSSNATDLLDIARRNSYLKVLATTRRDTSSIAASLWSSIKAGAEMSNGNHRSADITFLYGRALHFAAVHSPPNDDQLTSAIGGAERCADLQIYWLALIQCLEAAISSGLHIDAAALANTFTQAIRQLRSPSHDVRIAVIRTLELLYKIQGKAWPEVGELMSGIESTTPSVQNGRSITAQIHRLTLHYKNSTEDEKICRIIINYCFGLLHLRFSQAWEDSIHVLKEISTFEHAENMLLDVVSEWLEGGMDPVERRKCDWNPTTFEAARSDFECLNVNQVTAGFSNSLLATQDPETKLEDLFEDDHYAVELRHPFNRSQALAVLKALPQLAERTSRLLVPVLLQWATENGDEDSDGAERQRWTRKDQKAMLDVFAQFQNPRVLFRSTEVYSALLKLIGNGDAEIQKSALKALLAWKQSSVIRYEQHLMNFLDDARFREEISVFLRLDEEEGIKDADLAELSPVLLRLLYGLLVNRSGNASGVRGKQSKRKAVFIALARFPDVVLEDFIKIALEPLVSTKVGINGQSAHPRKQVGALNMLYDMLDCLGNRLEPFAINMGDVALLCLVNASKTKSEVENDDSNAEASLLKVVRQTGFRCMEQLVKCCPHLDWNRHAQTIVEDLLVPRLDNFAVEFAQSLSGILRLISSWSLHSQTSLYLVKFSPRIIPELASCIISDHTPSDVKKYICDEILEKLLDHYDGGVAEYEKESGGLNREVPDNYEVVQSVLRPNAGTILRAISAALKKSPGKDVLDSGVSCVSRLAGLIEQEAEAKDFIEIAAFLLKQPSAKVSFTTKRRLLSAIQDLVPRANLNSDHSLAATVYAAISPLFAMLRDRASRQLLCGVLITLTSSIPELVDIANLCEDLNSYASGKIEEPDFERRAKAFSKINEVLYQSLTPIQWRVILHNMLFYIQDNDEVAIRASASFTLQRFIESASQANTFTTDDFEDLSAKVLYPGLQHGMKNPSELVRIEYLSVLSILIKRMSFWPPIHDMIPLLADNDDEASFFLNILHVQQHRRLRALRRLGDQAKLGNLSSSNVSTIFWPLIEHFIFDAAQDESAHNLTAEAVTTVGALTACLDWSQYRAILRRYIAMIKNMEGKEKTTIRLISSVVDGLYSASSSRQTTMKQDDEIMANDTQSVHTAPLISSLPKESSLSSTITDSILPPLTSFLHLKDESTVSLRVPIGVVIVKLLKCLPESVMLSRLPGVLLDLCHILRSRDQGSRDMTRKTLSEVTALLGPTYFNFVVKELRSALQRGYQLHVLSFTVHSILIENLEKVQPGDLDHCVPELMAIIMDDIFGAAGQEKDAEDYISKMKEVKSSKSFDSMELLAKITTLSHLGQLVKPVRALLLEKLDLKTVKKIDELLRRLALGVTSNSAIVDRSVLIFCFEIISLTNEVQQPAQQNGKPLNDYKTRKYIIQMQAAHKSSKKGVTSSYTFKLVRFALDLLRSVLQKHEDLKTPQNLAGFVPVISEALVAGQEEVQLSVMRLLTGIMRVPLVELESNASTYVSEAVKVIKAAPSMTNESAQAGLKLISCTLRDRSSSKIRETDLAYVLKCLKPDLEEPDRQGVIFNFLKAVVGRKIVITEVYEVMDTVAAIMVTNQTKQARELARGIYFQFMMDYPQGKDRLNKQVAFLVKNLEYAYPEGRQSVLELLHLLLQKTNGDIVQDVSGMTFVPLVMMLANDDNPACREMAGVLIKVIFQKAEDDNRKSFTSLLRQWLEQEEQGLLKRVALQIWKIQTEAGNMNLKDTDFLLRHIETTLPSGEELVAQSDWESLFYALQLFAEITKVHPEITFSTKRNSLWNGVYRSLTFPHAWVKLSASRLVGLLFGDVGRSHKDSGLAKLPLQSSHGLQLSEADLRRLCPSLMRVLRQKASSEQLLAQTCRNIVFLGRVFAASGLEWNFKGANGVNGNHVEESEPDLEDGTSGTATPEEEVFEGGIQSASTYLLQSLGSILRRDPSSTDPASLPPKLAAMQTQQALFSALPSEQYIPVLSTLLHPLLVLTDASIPKPVSANADFTASQSRLTALAREVLSLVQDRVGTGAYVEAVTAAQKGIREAREERRVKRRIEAVSMPELSERRKGRRVEGKVRRRKEKAAEGRGRRRGW